MKVGKFILLWLVISLLPYVMLYSEQSMISAKTTIQQSCTDLADSIQIVIKNPLKSVTMKLEKVSKELEYLSREYPESPCKLAMNNLSTKLAGLAKEMEDTQKKLIQQLGVINKQLSLQIRYIILIEAIKEELKAGKYKEAYEDFNQLNDFWTNEEVDKTGMLKEIEKKFPTADIVNESNSWLNELEKLVNDGKTSPKSTFNEKLFHEFLQKMENIITYSLEAQNES